MIERINKIKNMGVFVDYSWDSTPDFLKYNLIFGWNRSGKTSVSRIFSSLEKKKLPELFNDALFEVVADGVKINQENLQNNNLMIKVFNSDFIKENIFFESSEKHCEPIIYVGEKDIIKNKKLNECKREETDLIKKASDYRFKFERKSKSEEDFRKNTAQIIKTNLQNPKIRDKYYDYNRGSVKTLLEENRSELVKLTEEELETSKKIITGEAKKRIPDFTYDEFNVLFNGKNINKFSELILIINDLLSLKIVAETINRLKTDNELNDWVKTGFELSKKKNEFKYCLYCEKPLDEDFINNLSKHFNKSYEDMQSQIRELISILETLKKKETNIENFDFYLDVKSEFISEVLSINKTVLDLNNCLKFLTEQLQRKAKEPFKELPPVKVIYDYFISYKKDVERINGTLNKHNLKIDNHDESIKTKKRKIENHYVALKIEEDQYEVIEAELKAATEQLEKANVELNAKQQEILLLEQEVSDLGKAIQEMNKYLECFFGQSEIKLDLLNEKSGYVIKRLGKIAANLSEGEQTAIAFSYFLTKANEKGADVSKTIIFIDDPISSLDSNYLFRCFSLMKMNFDNAIQLFVSTHNLELFNLVKDWFDKKNRNNNKRAEFYMIENIMENNVRTGLLRELDRTLKIYRSEYHYLYYLLKEFMKEEPRPYSEFYIIGNIARRFLEAFLKFKIPDADNLKNKIDRLPVDGVSQADKELLYKLVNVYSHQNNPISGQEHINKTEIKQGIEILFKILRISDLQHYEILNSNS